MKPGITVILTAYKRDYFGKQIPAVLGQSIKPEKVLIWQNENHVNMRYYITLYNDSISIVQSDHNFSFWGRFALYATQNTLPSLMMTSSQVHGGLRTAYGSQKKTTVS
jgi:hypothetical protein